MIYSNDVSSKYLVTEYDKTFHIEFLNTGAVLIDNVEYSEINFQEMVIAQDEDLESNKRKRTQLQEFSILDYKNNYRGKINTINYTEINKEIEESALIDHQKCINPKLRCTACGQYSPSSAPTKGYHSFTVGFMERGKLSSFTVLMTSTALGKFATLFCRGVLANAGLWAFLLLGLQMV